jgi:hypothetical protein
MFIVLAGKKRKHRGKYTLDDLLIVKEATPMPLSHYKNENQVQLLHMADSFWGHHVSKEIQNSVVYIADRQRCVFLILLMLHEKSADKESMISFSPADDCLRVMNLSWLSGRSWDKISSRRFSAIVADKRLPLGARFITGLYRQQEWWPKLDSDETTDRMHRMVHRTPEYLPRIETYATPYQQVLWLQKVMHHVTCAGACYADIDKLAMRGNPHIWATTELADSLAIALFGFDSTLLETERLFEFRHKALSTWPSLSDDVRRHFQPHRHSIRQSVPREDITFEKLQGKMLADRLSVSMTSWLEKAIYVFRDHLIQIEEVSEEKKAETEEDLIEQFGDGGELAVEEEFSGGVGVNVFFRPGLWMHSTNSVIHSDSSYSTDHRPIQLHLDEDPLQFLTHKILKSRSVINLLSIARISVEPLRDQQHSGPLGSPDENDNYPEMEDWDVALQPDYGMDALTIYPSL